MAQTMKLEHPWTRVIHVSVISALCLLQILLSACSIDNESTAHFIIEKRSALGVIRIRLNWLSADSNREGARHFQALVMNDDDTINCSANGISTIYVAVYDENDSLLKDNGSGWDCEDHRGTISEVPVGTDRRVVVSARDASGNELFRGEKTGVTVIAESTPDSSNPITVVMSPTDGSAPTITGTSPVNNATNIAVDTAITVTFDEAVAASSIGDTSFTIIDEDDADISGRIRYDEDTLTATITPDESFELSTVYTVTITSDVEDLSGNPLGAYSWSFKTKPGPLDLSVSLNDVIRSASSIDIHYTIINNGPYDADDITVDAWTHLTAVPSMGDVSSESEEYTMLASGDSETGMFSISGTDTTGTAYVIINTDRSIPESDTTNNIASALWFSFDDGTIQSWMTDPPSSGGSDVQWHISTQRSVSNAYAVRYCDADEDRGDYWDGTSNYGGFWLTDMAIGQNQVLTFDYFLENECDWQDGMVCSYDKLTVDISTNSGATWDELADLPVSFEDFLSYSVDLSAYAGDTGRIRFFFDTISDEDNSYEGAYIDNVSIGVYTPPEIVSNDPEDGDTDTRVNSIITITFSEDIDEDSIHDQNIFIDDGGNVVSGVLSYNADSRTVTFTPDFQLLADTTYNVTIKTGIRDLARNQMDSDYTWSFTTGSDDIPPTVKSVTPASGTTDVAINSDITIRFDDNINTSTINSSTIVVSDSVGPISGDITYDTDTHEVVFSPSPGLTIDKSYTILVDQAVADLSANQMANDYISTFTTDDINIPLTEYTVRDYTPETSPPCCFVDGDPPSKFLDIKLTEDRAIMEFDIRFVSASLTNATLKFTMTTSDPDGAAGTYGLYYFYANGEPDLNDFYPEYGPIVTPAGPNTSGKLTYELNVKTAVQDAKGENRDYIGFLFLIESGSDRYSIETTNADADEVPVLKIYQ